MRNKIKLISASVVVLTALVFTTLPVFAVTKQAQTTEINKSKQDRIMHERQRVQGLQSVAKAQIARAQKELDRLQVIISRIKLQRVKLDTATSTSADLTKIDEMITKAETLKKQIDTEIADAKAKQEAMSTALTKTEESINSSTSTNIDPTAPASTTIIKSVREFQASIKLIKKDLNTLHQSLQEIVKSMRKVVKSAEIKKEENE